MGQPINIVAQSAEDRFYQNYKATEEFFDIEDFVYYVSSAVATYYQQKYESEYAMLRQEKKEEVVSFSDELLAEQCLEVKDNRARIEKPVFVFAFDKQNTGIQYIMPEKEDNCNLFERSNLSEIWQYRYQPNNSRIYWRVDRNDIRFFTKGLFPVPRKIRVLFIPSYCPDMEIPDGLVDYAINAAVTSVKELGKGNVVKKTADYNDNKIIQSEIDKKAVK
jgi:hypothetical protein